MTLGHVQTNSTCEARHCTRTINGALRVARLAAARSNGASTSAIRTRRGALDEAAGRMQTAPRIAPACPAHAVAGGRSWESNGAVHAWEAHAACASGAGRGLTSVCRGGSSRLASAEERLSTAHQSLLTCEVLVALCSSSSPRLGVHLVSAR